jgi:hypothetical protein
MPEANLVIAPGSPAKQPNLLTMKTITHNTIRAAVLGCLLSVSGLACAQAVQSTTTTTTSAGTISDFSPNVITVRSQTSETPVSYSYSKTTTYVDQDGNPVSMDVVKSGLPVTVYYTQDGDRMVASKVVVQRTTTTGDAPVVEQKKSTTTTTTTDGR